MGGSADCPADACFECQSQWVFESISIGIYSECEFKVIWDEERTWFGLIIYIYGFFIASFFSCFFNKLDTLNYGLVSFSSGN